ncbi:MAG: 50S ribosomal protein L6 [Anaerolineaceae bacterium]|jgi:large subunit ribosomal protein L6|nr:50S ribosomal protein L6 [Anaerolineaceae bacterium]MDP3450886.1 50S ribosomal protein L6 [Anaerolineaceae bacterium]PKN95904.1 MAG: 50S ribosomal protein L6 [Chloroflexi bacterium HGW-Chloroflexi-5]
MSRIGRLPVAVPESVKVELNGSDVSVKGPKGEMARSFSPEIGITFEDGQIVVTRSSDLAPIRALHGTTRALINNMVTGVSTGFAIELEVDGVGYRVEMDGIKLVLYVGFSHPFIIDPPEGVFFEVDSKIRLVRVCGFDKEVIGQLASEIRKIRPPEPYLGKGIRYKGEKIRRKAGKAGKGAKK